MGRGAAARSSADDSSAAIDAVVVEGAAPEVEDVCNAPPSVPLSP